MDIQAVITALEDELGKAVRSDNQNARFQYCPHCKAFHPNNPAFAVELTTGVYYCHDCKQGGNITAIIQKIISTRRKKEIAISNEHSKKVINHFNNVLSVAKEGSLTDHYLNSRKINFATWRDLNWPLKEILLPDRHEIATYPFTDKNGDIVALQRTFVEVGTIIKKERKYFGPKSLGVAILKDEKEVFVAEGLETGLSVKQYLGNNVGLIITGDAGNLKSLAAENSWALTKRKKIFLAADNDLNNTGIKAAREVLLKFHNRALIFMPSLPGNDWNDVLTNTEFNFKKEWI